MTVIGFCSGKGGVGKTTVAVNVATLLSRKHSVIAVDSDIALPNLHSFFGIDEPFVTILDALKDDKFLEDAIYDITPSLHIMPSGSTIKALEGIKMERFNELIDTLSDMYDYVIVDIAAGLSKFAAIPMTASDEICIVVNPERPSIMDAQKVRKVAEMMEIDVKGAVINRYRGEKKMFDYTQNSVGKVIGLLRDSPLVRKSWNSGKPLVVKYWNSGIADDMKKLAMNLMGYESEIRPYGRLKARLISMVG